MVNGYNLNSIRPRQVPYMRRTLGVIFQDFRLIDKKTVWENLAFVMRAVGASARESRQRIMDCAVSNVKAYLEGAPVNVVNK